MMLLCKMFDVLIVMMLTVTMLVRMEPVPHVWMLSQDVQVALSLIPLPSVYFVTVAILLLLIIGNAVMWILIGILLRTSVGAVGQLFLGARHVLLMEEKSGAQAVIQKEGTTLQALYVVIVVSALLFVE